MSGGTVGGQVEPMSAAALDAAIATLFGLASPAQRAAATEIRRRVQERRLRVVVAGEAKRGKSTLVNRLLGRDLLPSGVTPVTAVATTVRYVSEQDEQLRVTYLDGRRECRTIDDLAALVTERVNPANVLGVAEVEVLLAAGALIGYPLEIVDTPGTGSVFEHNTDTAHAAYRSLDAVIVVLTADPPVSAAERDLLAELSTRAVRTFIVLNKADRLPPAELAEALRFTEGVCAGSGADPVPVWPLSAREADDGFIRFRDAFESYLGQHAAADALESLRARSIRLAAAMQDEAAVQLRALELAEGDSRDRIISFSERLTVIAEQAVELDDRLHATEHRLRRALDESARALVGALTGRARAAVAEAFVDHPAGLHAEQVESRGRQVVVELVTDEVNTWRAERARVLEAQLAEVVTAVDVARTDQLLQLRDAARTMLELTLASDPAPIRLQSSRSFWYAFERPASWEPPGADTIRRHAPGAARRAHHRVLAEVPGLVDRQIGRARADLQQRLVDSVRSVLAQLGRNHHDTLHQLRRALAEAASSRDAGAAEAEQRRIELASRMAAIDAVARQLRQLRLDAP